MDEEKRTYRARLDFLYQSIALYATTLVIYLVIRSIVAWHAFPTLWEDPLLLLLSAITLISVFALLYNLFMRRQIEVTPDALRFISRARERTISREEIAYVQLGPSRSRGRTRIRSVKIGLKKQRRPVRIRLSNFEHGRKLYADLRDWAGPLARLTPAGDARRTP